MMNTNSTQSIVVKVPICQKCGDEGIRKKLVYCVQCKTAAEHRYCLDVLPKEGKKITWSCEDCCPRPPPITPAPSRKSVRIGRVLKRKSARIESLKQGCLPDEEDSSSSGDSSEIPRIESKKPKRRFVIDDGSDSDEEIQSTMDEDIQFAPPDLSCCIPPVCPLSYAIWRGVFDVHFVKDKCSIRLTAHASNLTCSRAREAAASLKPLLDIEIMFKSEVWPQRFQEIPPHENDIALYFFPENGSDEITCDALLESMIELDVVLKTTVGDAQLLLFHSRKLPPKYWCVKDKYYLWAMFKGKLRPSPDQ